MHLYEVDGSNIAEELECAANVDAYKWQRLAEDRLVESQVVAISEDANAELVVAEQGGFGHPVTVAGNKEGAPSRCERSRDVPKEVTHVALNAIREMAVRLPSAEMAEREVDEKVLLATDGGGFEFLGVEEVGNPLVHAPPGADKRD